jgi:hypothetical protein
VFWRIFEPISYEGTAFDFVWIVLLIFALASKLSLLLLSQGLNEVNNLIFGNVIMSSKLERMIGSRKIVKYCN